MMHVLRMTDTPREHVEKWGDYNDAPPGWRAVDEAEIARSILGAHTPTMTEFRQIEQRDEQGNRTGMTAATLLYFHDGSGVAYETRWQERRIQWYRFGCAHEYRELSRAECAEKQIIHHGYCYHVYQCQKCQHITAHDTSG